MEMKMLTRATITTKSLEPVIRAAIEKEIGRKVKKLNWLTGSRIEGYGPTEHEVNYFDGVEVEFEDN